MRFLPAALVAIGSNLEALRVLELAGCVRIGDSGLVAVAQGTGRCFFLILGVHLQSGNSVGLIVPQFCYPRI